MSCGARGGGTHPLLALLVLVLASTIVRFAVSLHLSTPWLAPDEMIYALLGRSFWETGEMHVYGTSPFYGFYPIVAGLPLAALGQAAGLTALKALQAVFVSLTPVVIFWWARRMVSDWWAVVAALMTAAMPAFAYSGLILTDAALLPLATLALALCARSLVTPSWKNQLLAAGAVTAAIATRLQSLGLLPAIAIAVVLMAIFERDVRLLRRFLPLAAALALGLLVLALARRSVQSGGSSLGAYQSVAGAGYSISDVSRWSFRETGDVFMLVLGVPLFALFALVAARRELRRDRHVDALLAATIGYAVVTVVQVGAFVSRYKGGLDERYVIAIAPPMFVALVVWLTRGMPRPQPATAIGFFILSVPAVLLPVRQLVSPVGGNDSFMTVPLLDLAKWTSTTTMVYTWSLGAAATVLVVLFVPRRYARALAGLMIAGLLACSVLVQQFIDEQAHLDRVAFFGSASTSWVDRHVNEPVTYLDNGDPNWNGVWQQLYWNKRIDDVNLLAQSAMHPEGIPVRARRDGQLMQRNGKPFQGRLIVSSSHVTLVGKVVTRITRGRGEPDLVLWRVHGSPRLFSRTAGVLLAGEVVQPVKVTVYACRAGALALGLRAGSDGTRIVKISVNRLRPALVQIVPGKVRQLWVSAPPNADGRKRCVFTIAPDRPITSYRIVYQTGASVVPRGVEHHEFGAGTVELAMNGRVKEWPPRVGYCFHGAFLNLLQGQPQRDPAWRGATLAHYIAGEGLTCSPPPAGYVAHGFATAALGVLPGIYRFYGPETTGTQAG